MAETQEIWKPIKGYEGGTNRKIRELKLSGTPNRHRTGLREDKDYTNTWKRRKGNG